MQLDRPVRCVLFIFVLALHEVRGPPVIAAFERRKKIADGLDASRAARDLELAQDKAVSNCAKRKLRQPKSLSKKRGAQIVEEAP